MSTGDEDERMGEGIPGLHQFITYVLTCWEIVKSHSVRSTTVYRLLRMACILRGKTGL